MANNFLEWESRFIVSERNLPTFTIKEETDYSSMAHRFTLTFPVCAWLHIDTETSKNTSRNDIFRKITHAFHDGGHGGPHTSSSIRMSPKAKPITIKTLYEPKNNFGLMSAKGTDNTYLMEFRCEMQFSLDSEAFTDMANGEWSFLKAFSFERSRGHATQNSGIVVPIAEWAAKKLNIKCVASWNDTPPRGFSETEWKESVIDTILKNLS